MQDKENFQFFLCTYVCPVRAGGRAGVSGYVCMPERERESKGPCSIRGQYSDYHSTLNKGIGDKQRQMLHTHTQETAWVLSLFLIQDS